MPRKPNLPGSTLVETLVTMLVSVLVALSIAEGLTLFTRMQMRCTATLQDNGRRREGLARIRSLTDGADSIRVRAETPEIFRQGRLYTLHRLDSAIICRSDSFRDTLLQRVSGLELREYPDAPDTVAITTATGFVVLLPVRPAAERYEAAIREIEENYGYE